MNIFRLAGDMTHLASVLVLLLKIHTIKSCAGVSLKTQELYAIVFATRYLDIFTSFVSIYNTSMKLVFLGSSFSIVWYMRYHKAVHRTYDREQDTFRHWFLVLPCLLLALLIHEKFTFLEVLWTFSLYLEAVAILPQLVLLFYVDNIPIRVYKNDKGVSYPSKPMQVEASLWNGDDWATDGGRTKVNWSYSPFIAHFQDFSLSGCNIDGLSNNVGACESSNYWWNAGKYQRLSGYEQNMYEHVRKKYMNYDYCTDRSKYQTPPRECY